METLALRNKVKEKEHSGIYIGVKRRNGNENVFARPNGLRENAATLISCRDLDLPERRGIPVVEGRKNMHRCAPVAKQ